MILPIFRNTKNVVSSLYGEKTEYIQYLKDLLAIAKQVKDYNFIPEEVTPDFEKSFIRRFKEFLNPTCKKMKKQYNRRT